MEKSDETKNILPWDNRICILALIALATTASNERPFCKMKIIKNYFISNVAYERLNFLMLLNTVKHLTDCLKLDNSGKLECVEATKNICTVNIMKKFYYKIKELFHVCINAIDVNFSLMLVFTKTTQLFLIMFQ